ncbi:MAG: Transcriptional regulator [Ilumatobacteraceae bacterium]|nr:Transcriptional regulator [Ilumatobacteraceae bacterium]
MLDICVLGPLRVTRDGEDVPVTAAKVRTLALVFATRPRDIVSVGRLIDVLWPDDPPDSAKKLIHVYISQLRTAFGPESISTVAPGYRLDVPPATIDAHRFELLCAEAQHALIAGAASVARMVAGRALDLWRGPALADVATDPSFIAEAARLTDLQIDCRAVRIDAELELGNHALVLADLHRLSAEHPFREHLRERLALALYRCGRQSDALAELAAARRDLVDGFGLDPGRRLADLERAILDQDPALDVAQANGAATARLPVPASRLIGREHEIEFIGGLVQRDSVRLVTIVGAGGSGKTRVALAVARSVAESFADGAVFVELAALRDPNLVVSAIAGALGVAETSEESLAVAVASRIQSRDLLLVVDNFEHVIDAAVELTRLLSSAPRLTLLVTSRRVLHLTGEHVVPLSPLSIDDAMVLFHERADERGGTVTAGGSTDPVRAICTRLDCLPLAIELAAARAAMLTPEELLDRLVGEVSELGVGPRDAPARQRTLEQTLRWSTELLSATERHTMACCSVFTGGSTLAAAEVVCATSLDVLAALVDSSLLQRMSNSGDTRLAMLETVRAHADGLFQDATTRRAAQLRHRQHFVGLAETVVLKGEGQSEGLATIDADIDNLRLAMDRAELDGDDAAALRIATALYRYWYLRGLFREGRDRITRPLEHGAGGAGPLRALALRALAGLQFMLGDLERARALAVAGIEAGLAVDDHVSIVACHTVLGLIAKEQGAYAEAGEHFRQSEIVAQRHGLEEDVVVANTNLGELAFATGDLAQARRRWETTLVTQGGPEANLTFALLGLGALALQEGRLDEGERHLIRARDLARQAGFNHNTAMALVALAGIASQRGDDERAAVVIGEAHELLAATGGKLTTEDAAVLERAAAATRDHLGSERFDQLAGHSGRPSSTSEANPAGGPTGAPDH